MIVTIGIPFVNNVDTLPLAIRSVFAQTFSDWELILVDDGSCDGSLETARTVDDPRVKVVSDGLNRGLPHRLNQIATLASGKYIARMDSDDMMHPDRIARQVEYMEANPHFDVVGTTTYTIDGESKPIGIRSTAPAASDAASVLRGAIFIHPSITGHKDWFLSNPYDEAFMGSEDYELWCRTCRISSFGKLQMPLLYYRENVRSAKSYLKHYLKALQYQRAILRNYGPDFVGWRRCVVMFALSYLKGGLYSAATTLGTQSALVNRRSKPLNECDHRAATYGLEAIFETHVPGFGACDGGDGVCR